jgi:PQQ-like domain
MTTRRRLMTRVTIAFAALALAACKSADSPVAPLPTQQTVAVESISVQGWRRPPVTVTSTLRSGRPETAAAFLALASNALTSIDPRSGGNTWTATFAARPREVSAAGSVFRVTYPDVNLGGTIDAFVDEASGAKLWSVSGTALANQSIIASSAEIIVFNLNDTLFVGRDRATGAVRWSTRVSLGPCVQFFSRCWTDAGQANGVFHLVRNSVSGPLHLLKLTQTGVATLLPFADPLAFGFNSLQTAVLDSAGASLFFTSFIGISAIDANTGALRWSAVHPFSVDGVPVDQPVVSVARGLNPMIHLLYEYDFVANGNFAREFVVDGAVGKAIWSRAVPAGEGSTPYIGHCGADGMVVVRSSGRFFFSNTRTGAVFVGTVRDTVGNTPAQVPGQPLWVSTFASGHVVLSNANTELIGFRCRP